MNTQITDSLYRTALKRVDELLKAVNESTPKDAPEMVELCLFSDIIEEYESERYPIAAPTFAQVIEEKLTEQNMQKKTLASKLGVSPSRISDFIAGRAEPSLSQASSICRILNIEPQIALQL